MENNNKLFLFDGHALVFRMYYAMLRKPMINSKGEDMSILYGFVKYLLELTAKEQPSYLAVSFDPPGKTFRHEMYPEYKATRSATPQLVIDALEPLCELCKAMKIPVLMKKGFEADDVIGSMAKRAEKEGLDVYMVTPDKDYGQLVSEHVFQYKPGKSGAEDEILACEDICKKYGIQNTSQVTDMLAICGDTADNVPGVNGVGEVGAGKLISLYGSLENIYANLDKLSPKMAEKFIAAKDHIDLSYQLVTIKTDIDLSEVTIEDMAISDSWDPLAATLFDRYEFNSLKKYLADKLPAQTIAEAHQSDEIEYEIIDAGKLIALAKKTGSCALVPEYGGADNIFAKLESLTVSVFAEGRSRLAKAGLEVWKELLEDEKVSNCGYDLKKLCSVLAYRGVSLNGTLLDIELMHYIIDPEKSHNIEMLSRTYLNTDMEKKKEAESDMPSLFDLEEDDNEAKEYKMAAVCGMLAPKLNDILQEQGLASLYYDMEEPLVRVLAKMERNGVAVEMSQLNSFARELGKEISLHQNKIREYAEDDSLNPSSPKQLGVLLYEKLQLDPKVKKSAKSSYPTDESTLSSLYDRHPVIEEILEYRAAKKLLSTYIEPFPGYISSVDGRVHTTFNQALTSTGRLSSSKPNLQNIPIRTEKGKEIRRAFVPGSSDGVIVSADYSQIELRIMAHLSGDKHLIEAFKSGQDVHAATAAKIFGISLEEVTSDHRRIAKTANFGIMYGISAFGLSQRLGCSRAQAKQIIDDYFANFPAIRAFIENTLASAREKGYVETLFGRRRYIADINARNATVRQLAERNAVNAPIQGTSADIIKLAMIRLEGRMKKEGLKSRMVLQIHDELLFDVPAAESERLQQIAIEEMENVIELSIPITVECNAGKNWLEAH